MKCITIVCVCGGTQSAPMDEWLKHPSGYVYCTGLTQEMERCKKRWSVDEILKRARGGAIADFSMPVLEQTKLL